MISPAQLAYIFALLKTKNFQRAAEECHVTQPTLSMQLKKFEETIGYKIFNRDSHPISLTTAGETLYPTLLDLQNNYDKLNQKVQQLKGTYQAEIKIGIIPTISNYLVPEIYSKWKNEIQHINLEISEITSENLIEAIKKKEIDFGVLAGPLDDLSLQQQILYNEEILVYAPHIKEEKIKLKQLEKETPWLLSEGNCLRTQMINFCQLEENSKLEWNYEGGNLHLLTKMVEQEGGYTLIPRHYLPILNLNQSHLKKIDGPTPFRQIIGIHLKRNTKTEDINRIMQIIQRYKNKDSIYIEPKKTQILPWKI